MDILAIVIAGIFGGVGGALGVLLGRALIKDDGKNAKAIRQIIIITSVVLLGALWQVVLKPSFYDKPKFRSDLEKTILGDPTFNNIFKSMREYDPTNYNLLLDKLTLVANQKGRTTEELTLEGIQTGAQYAKRYFLSANATEVHRYLKTYYEFLSSLGEDQALFICQLENPQTFGTQDTNSISNRKFLNVVGLFDGIIKSSLSDNLPFDKTIGETLFNKTIESYRSKYPQHILTLGLTENLTTTENVKRFAKAYVDLYAEILQNSVEDAAYIYKYLRDLQ